MAASISREIVSALLTPLLFVSLGYTIFQRDWRYCDPAPPLICEKSDQYQLKSSDYIPGVRRCPPRLRIICPRAL